MTSQRAVLYRETGSPSVLAIEDIAVPTPGEERALLAVRAVGINPYDVKVVAGAVPRDAPFPRGVGSDVAGVVVSVGDGATYADGSDVAVGDAVFGWGINTLRENVIVRAANIARVPDGLSLAAAGSLSTAALAARACWDALTVGAADTVLVSPASGAVGSFIAQWAALAGARVIGTTSAAGADRLLSLGITPVAHGAGLAERVAALTQDAPLTAVFDLHGRDALAVGAQLGVPAARMCALFSDAAAEFGAATAGNYDRSIATLSEIAQQIARGDVHVEIAHEYPLTEVQSAFAQVASGHSGGKVVVAPTTA